MSQEHLTGAAYPLHLGSKTFDAVPLSDLAITELNNWVRGKYIHNARQAITPEMTKEERDEITSIAIRDASTLFAFSGQGAKILATIEGVARLAYVMVNKEVSESELLQLMMEPENIRETNRVMALQNISPAVVKNTTIKKKLMKELKRQQKRKYIKR